jgi:hypothetical protein
MDFLPFRHPPAWTEPSGVLLELPGVEYPRKLLFPAGHHSLVLVRTKRGIKWALIEDASLPHMDTHLLRLILGCEKDEVGVMEVFPPEGIGLSSHLVYRYIAYEEKIARYMRTETYNHFVVMKLTERLEETRDAIDSHLATHLPPMCEACKAQVYHAH